MTLSNTTNPSVNPLTNADETVSKVASETPFLYVFYNSVTKHTVGPVRYRASGQAGTVGGLLACDTFADLQTAAAALGLIGTLIPDPTPVA